MVNDEKLIKIENLVEELNRYSKEYYTFDNPSISDTKYDEKYDLLQRLEKETGIIFPYSPTQRVGDVVLKGFQKHKHKAKLWSLDKVKTIENLKKWHESNVKFINNYNLTHVDKLPEVKYIVTKKFDGLTVNCSYEKQVMNMSATRGTDGETGENVFEQTKTIKTLPLKINCLDTMEVHGEIMMTKQALEEYNLNNSDKPIKNLRNGAAGALRNLDVRETAKRKLIASFYDIGYKEGLQFTSYKEMLDFIINQGFPVDTFIRVCSTFDEVEKAILDIKALRSSLNYDIDGAVIAIDDIKTRKLLGYGIKFPKYSMAFKYTAEQTTTKLRKVEWGVGKTGRVTPVGLFDEINLGGADISKATLNNIEDIRRKNIKIRSTITVALANDVIPEITGTVGCNLDEEEITPPIVCPSCGSELIKDGPNYYCTNSLSCEPQIVKSIVHYADKEAMNIEGFSDKTAEQLLKKLNVRRIPDLYKLKREDLILLDKFGEKKVHNLLTAIEKSKKCSLAAFIYALSIPNVGKKASKDISNKFKSLNKIIDATYEEFILINDIGDITAKEIVNFFADPTIKNSITELLFLGITPFHEENHVNYKNPFVDKTIVITGTLSYSRNEVKAKLESLGAKISSSVSKKNTDFVLYGDDPGSKYDKAIELGVATINEDEFKHMLLLEKEVFEEVVDGSTNDLMQSGQENFYSDSSHINEQLTLF